MASDQVVTTCQRHEFYLVVSTSGDARVVNDLNRASIRTGSEVVSHQCVVPECRTYATLDRQGVPYCGEHDPLEHTESTDDAH